MRTGDPEEATSEALSQQLAENFNNGDFSALAAMLAEDIALFPPGLQGLHGRDAVRAYWRQARRVRAVQFAAASIKPLGDGKATVLRLHSVSGKSESVKLTWPTGQPKSIRVCPLEETPGELVGGDVSLPPYGVITLCIEYK